MKKSLLYHKEASIGIVTVILIGICILCVPRFKSGANIGVLLRAVPSLGLVSIAVCLLMIAGEFDLSVGSTFAFAPLIMVLLLEKGANVWIAFSACLFTGAIIGFLNGFITIKARIPSFITTLGTMMIWRGGVLVLSGGHPRTFFSDLTFTAIFSGKFVGIPTQFIWLVGFTLLFWFLLENHEFGNWVFACGGNEDAAKAIGIPTKKVKLICFILVGIMAAFAGIIETSRISTVFPIQGRGLELQAIAATVIGGTALTGGEGTVLGTFLGVGIVYIINNLLLLLRAPAYYFQLFVGILIIVAVVFNTIIKKRQFY